MPLQPQSDWSHLLSAHGIQIVHVQEWVRTLLGTPAKEGERLGKRAIRGHTETQCGPERDTRVVSRRGKMSLNNGQTLTASGQDLTRNGSNNRAPWEDARMVLKPSTPTRKPKPVSIPTPYLMQHPFTGTVPIVYMPCKVWELLTAKRMLSARITSELWSQIQSCYHHFADELCC